MTNTGLDFHPQFDTSADWPERDQPASRKTRINNFMRDGLRRLDTDEPIPFFCECNRSDCFSTVWVSGAALDRLRRSGNRELSAHGGTGAPASVAA
jgi:hypothetical protein